MKFLKNSMKRALPDKAAGRLRSTVGLLAGVLAIILLAGCEDLKDLRAQIPGYETGGRYQPVNFYRRSELLPVQLKRVAVLPLTAARSSEEQQAGVDALEPVLHLELEKSGAFEVISVSRDQLRQWTGEATRRSDEALPLDFFARLHERTGCDAVLFSQLTRYQAYQPVAVGWKFSLVLSGGTEGAEMMPPKKVAADILWSVDEVLDAGDPAVANSARAYYSQHLHNETPGSDSSMVLRSPTWFGQFSLNALLGTLPARQKH
jgi:hypothetical protein